MILKNNFEGDNFYILIGLLILLSIFVYMNIEKFSTAKSNKHSTKYTKHTIKPTKHSIKPTKHNTKYKYNK